jgi:hypothetical protein
MMKLALTLVTGLAAVLTGCGAPAPEASVAGVATPSPASLLAGVPLDCDDVPRSDCSQALVAAATTSSDFAPADVVQATLRRQSFPDVPVESFVMILTLKDGRISNVAMMRERPGDPIVVGMFEPTPEPFPTLDPAVCATRQHDAPELEARLPTEIAGELTCRFSIHLPGDPAFLAQLSEGLPGIQAALDTVPGSEPSELSLGFAQTGDPNRSTDALQLIGGDGDAMRKAILPFESRPVSWTSIAGRSVAIVGPDPAFDVTGLTPHHYVASGDTVYIVSGFASDSPVLAEIILGLP